MVASWSEKEIFGRQLPLETACENNQGVYAPSLTHTHSLTHSHTLSLSLSENQFISQGARVPGGLFSSASQRKWHDAPDFNENLALYSQTPPENVFSPIFYPDGGQT